MVARRKPAGQRAPAHAITPRSVILDPPDVEDVLVDLLESFVAKDEEWVASLASRGAPAAPGRTAPEDHAPAPEGARAAPGS